MNNIDWTIVLLSLIVSITITTIVRCVTDTIKYKNTANSIMNKFLENCGDDNEEE